MNLAGVAIIVPLLDHRVKVETPESRNDVCFFYCFSLCLLLVKSFDPNLFLVEGSLRHILTIFIRFYAFLKGILGH